MLEVKDFTLPLIHSKFLVFLKKRKRKKKENKKASDIYKKMRVWKYKLIDWEGRKKMCLFNSIEQSENSITFALIQSLISHMWLVAILWDIPDT